MEEITSTPNGGSKNKIDRSKYIKAKTNDVSWKELNDVIDSKGFEKFDFNSMAVSFNDNVKIIGGDAEENELVASNSYATYEFDIEKMEIKLANVRDINKNNEGKINAIRKKAETKKRREQEAKKALEEKEAESLKEKAEKNLNGSEK